jgi:oligosaccharide reducing-end xylanase
MAIRPRAWVLAGLLLSSSACRTTLDSLGCKEHSLNLDAGGDIPSAITLAPLLGPASYPNAFHEILGKSETDINNRVNNAYAQLFHGDPDTESILVEDGPDRAYVYDRYHKQIRSEGLGLGLLISVSLDQRSDFDRLWRYSKSIQVVTGPAQGYFPSSCGEADEACFDPFGIEQMITALLLARGRWQASPGDVDYEFEAASLLDVVRNKDIYNCAITGDVTALFDDQTNLPYDTPVLASAGKTRPSVLMPAYYDLWYQATDDLRWSQAADAARIHLQASAHPVTGLIPWRTTFDGSPVPGSDVFNSESLRVFFNIAIDGIWSGRKPWLVSESNLVLQFFASKGITNYGHMFSLDGATLQSFHDRALVAANGALAIIASSDLQRDFVNEVWNLGMPSTSSSRYYSGLMHMLALVILSGRLRVY